MFVPVSRFREAACRFVDIDGIFSNAVYFL